MTVKITGAPLQISQRYVEVTTEVFSRAYQFSTVRLNYTVNSMTLESKFGIISGIGPAGAKRAAAVLIMYRKKLFYYPNIRRVGQ